MFPTSDEQVLQQRSTRPRLFQLDALRGLAAVIVVMNHLWMLVPGMPTGWAVELIADGRTAVVLFFVLSGYVLSLPYWSGKPLPYAWYLVRRFCRIYIPFAAAAVLSVFLAYAFRHSTLILSPWFNQTWHTPITPKILVRQFLMVPMSVFNTAFWSLTYEMQMSVVMPFVCLAMRRTSPIVFTVAYGTLVFLHPLNPYDSPQYPILSYQIGFLFVLGATLARYSKELKAFFGLIGRWSWLFLVVSFVLFYFNLIIEHSTRLGNSLSIRIFLINGIGAAGLILCSINLGSMARLLKHPLPEYLGRVSYSLYLTHGAVLFAVADLLWGHMHTRWLIALGIAVILICAHLFCIAVEEPSMRFGKWLYAGPKRPT